MQTIDTEIQKSDKLKQLQQDYENLTIGDLRGDWLAKLAEKYNLAQRDILKMLEL